MGILDDIKEDHPIETDLPLAVKEDLTTGRLLEVYRQWSENIPRTGGAPGLFREEIGKLLDTVIYNRESIDVLCRGLKDDAPHGMHAELLSVAIQRAYDQGDNDFHLSLEQLSNVPCIYNLKGTQERPLRCKVYGRAQRFEVRHLRYVELSLPNDVGTFNLEAERCTFVIPSPSLPAGFMPYVCRSKFYSPHLETLVEIKRHRMDWHRYLLMNDDKTTTELWRCSRLLDTPKILKDKFVFHYC